LATCGDAMLVPEIVLYPGAILLPFFTAFQVDLMHTSGAPMSTSVPKLLKKAKSSSVAPSWLQVFRAPPKGSPL
jgi:hypothetical protein